ncbi:unnamed protein product [Medioppia subpectinata]|uniref:Sodium-dependent nutrient amino acid transporter 1 n=1 Tax=Medioppia subpectinata TaxID=1979941 RepID=A0A7R9KJ41_9ACAR|nr:unnamed protein product [Medioppia subpectinata]CAG2104338.1 unnamed protein product [Medioppia subpectinata]
MSTDLDNNGHTTTPPDSVPDGVKDRGQWSKGIEFLLSCIAMSVGLGNVWGFPHAGAFLIPYLILLFIIGRPLYYMELAMGQFSGRGPIKVWKCVPAFKGIGFAQLFSISYVIIFYNYIMALTLYYFVMSFKNPLPWTQCNEDYAPGGTCSANTTMHNSEATQAPIGQQHNWAEIYYLRHVLNQSTGLNDMNSMSWQIVICLICSWTLVYLSIIKGVSSMGKVAYFTAIFPYTVLIALLGVTLSTDGAIDGVKYFFTPQWEKLLEPIVWYRAVEQSFFSLAVCFGTLVMYSSYNEFSNNVYRDSMIIAVLDTFTSLLAGCVIFSNLGHLAKTTGKDIKNVVDGGLGLTFVVYPDALGKIPVVPQLWSVLFFIMMFTLGIGSSVSQVETILTAIKDEFTWMRQKKEILALVACVIFCLCGLPLTTDAGTYVMELLKNYGVGTAAIFYAICQMGAVFWAYGLRRFCFDIQFMLKRPIGWYWQITWGLIGPVALIIIFIYGNVEIGRVGNRQQGIPAWGTSIGWVLAVIAMIQIPLWMIITIKQQPGHNLRQKFVTAFKPAPDWGPTDPKIYQEWRAYTDQHFDHNVSIKAYMQGGQHILTRINQARNAKLEILSYQNIFQDEAAEISQKIYNSFQAATVDFANNKCLAINELSMRDHIENNCYEQLDAYMVKDLYKDIDDNDLFIGEFAYSNLAWHTYGLGPVNERNIEMLIGPIFIEAKLR